MGVLGNFIYLNYTIVQPQRASNLLKLQNTDKKESSKMDLLEMDLIEKMKLEEPNLFQIMADYLNGKLSKIELQAFFDMDHEARWTYVDNYKAR